MKKFLVLLLLWSCTGTERNSGEESELEKFKSQHLKDSIDLAEKVKHIEWETSMRISLLKRGIKGELADRHIDSVAVNDLFDKKPPMWYMKYKKRDEERVKENDTLIRLMNEQNIPINKN